MSKAKKPAAKKKAKSARVYLVLRDAFDANDYDGLHFDRPTNDDGKRVSAVPVRAFATRKAANEYARQLDAELRAAFPPPLFATDDDSDDRGDRPLLAVVVAGQLKALGLPAIKFGKQEYDHGKQFREWWTKHAKDLSAEQKAALWEPFADLKFHRVKQIDLEG